ncbi:MAG: RloB family protein [archaeon]
MGKPIFYQKRSRDSYRRPFGGRKPWKRRILIVCEGERTEPLYFKAFRISSVKVEIAGTGRNTDSLVEFAIDLEEKTRKNHEPYDEVWCVFDKDDFPEQNFNRAFQLIENRKNFRIAYSNEAFELWYLLHFHYYNTAIDRSRYERKLTRLLGYTYKKKDPEMYQRLLNRQPDAIRNARNLLNSYRTYDPFRNDPSTTVVDLVEELNKYVD